RATAQHDDGEVAGQPTHASCPPKPSIVPPLTANRSARGGVESGMPLTTQIVWLFVLAAPVACVAWTVTHEEILREPREYWEERSQHARRAVVRKFFYVLTCEYCFSHYITAAFLAITRFHLLLPDWRGYAVAFFAIVLVANLYMGLFGRLRLDIK